MMKRKDLRKIKIRDKKRINKNQISPAVRKEKQNARTVFERGNDLSPHSSSTIFYPYLFDIPFAEVQFLRSVQGVLTYAGEYTHLTLKKTQN